MLANPLINRDFTVAQGLSSNASPVAKVFTIEQLGRAPEQYTPWHVGLVASLVISHRARIMAETHRVRELLPIVASRAGRSRVILADVKGGVC
jgi:hypothetical protein